MTKRNHDWRCDICGRRVGIYLTEMGPYVAHVIPLALHKAVLREPTERSETTA